MLMRARTVARCVCVYSLIDVIDNGDSRDGTFVCE